MSENQPEKPKLVVDEDWKAQVEAEREAMRHQQPTAEQPQGEASKGGPAAAPEGPQERLPPASFGMLVSSLATQAIAALGQIPDPVENKAVVRLDVARHYIDTLAMLEDKTRGNLTAEESKMLTGVLHELRMLFVAADSPPPQPPSPETG